MSKCDSWVDFENRQHGMTKELSRCSSNFSINFSFDDPEQRLRVVRSRSRLFTEDEECGYRGNVPQLGIRERPRRAQGSNEYYDVSCYYLLLYKLCRYYFFSITLVYISNYEIKLILQTY